MAFAMLPFAVPTLAWWWLRLIVLFVWVVLFVWDVKFFSQFFLVVRCELYVLSL
jgi:hypothetical protein